MTEVCAETSEGKAAVINRHWGWWRGENRAGLLTVRAATQS